METTLHRQLKEFYCGNAAAREVRVGGYRIDAVVDGRLIEIQQASLGALQNKVRSLLEQHDVIVVKPLAAEKTIVRRPRRGAAALGRRSSPKHETIWHLFLDLVHFVEVFPHPRLTLEVLLTEQEEWRIAKKPRRWRGKDYRVEDRLLVGICARHVLRTAGDLLALLPADLADPFTTAQIARTADIPRWLAQKMAYCLHRIGAIDRCGKQKHAWLYTRSPAKRRAA